MLSRKGTTLRVVLQVPSCDTSHYRPHLLEADAAIVVWATATPTDRECAALPRLGETFTLRAPIGERPVVDLGGRVLLPPDREGLEGWP